jgi:hypothetical protein
MNTTTGSTPDYSPTRWDATQDITNLVLFLALTDDTSVLLHR